MIIREKFLDIFTGKEIVIETDSRDYLEEVKNENRETERESDDHPS
ncbi:MAG: hypothetical protein ACW99G_24055 [Candidatus Thorarchaeota archaeon]|jgi:hypothetical protein